MIEYGYINDGGYLVSRSVEEYKERYKDGDEIKERVVSVEMQVIELAKNGWKPVELIDESKLECEDGYVVRITPYDAGDKIAYRYMPVFDVQKIRREIQTLRDDLDKGDYKITKCYEAFLMGENLPYDVVQLHQARQVVRNKINELESVLLKVEVAE